MRLVGLKILFAALVKEKELIILNSVYTVMNYRGYTQILCHNGNLMDVSQNTVEALLLMSEYFYTDCSIWKIYIFSHIGALLFGKS